MKSVGAPHFFVDRSLAADGCPAFFRADGWALTTLDEHFGDHGPHVTDVEWLTLRAACGCTALARTARFDIELASGRRW